MAFSFSRSRSLLKDGMITQAQPCMFCRAQSRASFFRYFAIACSSALKPTFLAAAALDREIERQFHRKPGLDSATEHEFRDGDILDTGAHRFEQYQLGGAQAVAHAAGDEIA